MVMPENQPAMTLLRPLKGQLGEVFAMWKASRCHGDTFWIIEIVSLLPFAVHGPYIRSTTTTKVAIFSCEHDYFTSIYI